MAVRSFTTRCAGRTRAFLHVGTGRACDYAGLHDYPRHWKERLRVADGTRRPWEWATTFWASTMSVFATALPLLVPMPLW